MHEPNRVEQCRAVVAQRRSIVQASANAEDQTQAGAVAFSRTGDPDTGDLSEAVILARYGDVPDDLSGL
jgi:hypothetical protein